MIVSNEPGYYENGKFGIRIENLVVVKKRNKVLNFENDAFLILWEPIKSFRSKHFRSGLKNI